MAHPFKAEADRNKASRLHRVAGTKVESGTVERKIKTAMHEHDKQLHGGAKTHLKFANGGVIPGRAAGGRLDKPGRKGTTVNVIVAPGGGGAGAPPVPPMMPPPAMPLPPPPMGAGPGAGPTGLPPMMPPPGGMPMRKRGGAVYTAGAGSGEGREEKIKNYGAKARKIAPENR